MTTYLTSQTTLIDNIVATKQADKDYVVSYVRVTIDGDDYAYVIDGHHSLGAAKLDKAEPEFVDVTDEYARELEHLGHQGFLDAHNNGEGWWDAMTGQPIW